MRLKYGYQYTEDIKMLRSLKIKDFAAYQAFMKTIENEYSISNKTIYRDMKKKNPGLRKVRNDSGKIKRKISPKEKSIMSEVLLSGHTGAKSRQITESLTGNRISNTVYKRLKPQLGRVELRHSNFGGDIKTFLEKICDYNLIAPSAGIKLKSGKFSFIVNKDDLSDIILILTNAYNRANDDGKLALDKNEMFKKKIFQLHEYNIKLAEDSADLKSLESITRMYNSIQEEHDLGADFEVVYKICSSLRPGISRQEIISLIKLFSKGD